MSSLGSVLEHLKSGKTIAYPTEGVWGLGCDPRNPNAIENLLSLKARSSEKGLILIASKFEHFLEFSHVEDQTQGNARILKLLKLNLFQRSEL
jgi:L-threonylcarbamoyladenylate synthase